MHMRIETNVAPTIETERLLLRPHRPSDFGDVYALWGEPEVTAYITGRPSTREEAWSRLLRYAGHWAMLGYGYWAVTEKATGRFIGEMGLADYHRDIDPPLGDSPELGWVLSAQYHRRGYAFEALTAILGWASAKLPGGEICCIITPGNDASIGLAGKLGFREAATVLYRNEPTLLYRR